MKFSPYYKVRRHSTVLLTLAFFAHDGLAKRQPALKAVC